jgi:hypothetical protein
MVLEIKIVIGNTIPAIEVLETEAKKKKKITRKQKRKKNTK